MSARRLRCLSATVLGLVAATSAWAQPAPSNLSATTVSSTQINLSWTDNTWDEDLFDIYRSTSAAGAFTYVASTPANVSNYSNTGLTPSTTYYYKVRAYRGDDPFYVTAFSNTASATTQAPPDTTAPTTPTGLTATAVSSSEINLSWNASTDSGGSGLAGYQVDVSSSSTGPWSMLTFTITTSTSNTGLPSSTTRWYRVQATDLAGNDSAFAGPVSATTQAPPDTTAPTTPTGLTATAVSSSEINLSW
ncbi:MAG: fibronectin type III domain-containing protein, partial [Planctomycetes bacterium]|nr:fibronectin type III domain-containing protein [Planctomycetota bacterium]